METGSSSAFPLEEFKTLAEKVLKNLKENPIILPPPSPPSWAPLELMKGFKFHCHFGSYHYAGAYLMYVIILCPAIDSRLGYYYKVKASEDGTDHGPAGFQNNPEHIKLSIDMYLRAASLYPDDEPEKHVHMFPPTF
jgi:hypothetical protein